MEFDELFLTGVALRLAAAGFGTWSPEGAYLPGQTAIVIDDVPQEPANVITLSAYGVEDAFAISDSVQGLQVRVRCEGQDPRLSRALSARIFEDLHGAHDFALPTPPDEDNGVWVEWCLRRSHTSGGKDENGRWSQIQNFYVGTHRPTPHRI